ncbi:hypothetical protein P3W45_000764 [Vairimorpha bombi]|jgi:hypothetical protein
MNQNNKNDGISLLQLEQSLYDLKTYVKDMFLIVIDKIDDMESKINQLKSLQNSKKKIEGTDNNRSLLGDYISSGSNSNRRSKNDEEDTKKKKVRGKNEAQVLTDSLKKMSQENNTKNIDKSANDTKNDEEDAKKTKKEEYKSRDPPVGDSKNRGSSVGDSETTPKDPKKNNKSTKKDFKESEKETNDVQKETKKQKKKSKTDKLSYDKPNNYVSKEDKDAKPDAASLIESEFSYKGKHTERTYDLIKMKERFFKNFGDNWFTVPKCCKLFFNSIRKPPTEEWIAALDCMVEKKMLDRNEGDKLKYKVIE